MKIKTSELIGAQLDWAVAKAEIALEPTGNVRLVDLRPTICVGNDPDHEGSRVECSPSTDWAQGGPIIEREGITSVRVSDEYGRDERGFCNNVRTPVWAATSGRFGLEFSTEHQQHEGMFQILASDVIYGPAPLIAAMRFFVASKLGNEVEIPDELL